MSPVYWCPYEPGAMASAHFIAFWPLSVVSWAPLTDEGIGRSWLVSGKARALSQVWGLGKLSEPPWSSKPSLLKEARDGSECVRRVGGEEKRDREGVRPDTPWRARGGRLKDAKQWSEMNQLVYLKLVWRKPHGDTTPHHKDGDNENNGK